MNIDKIEITHVRIPLVEPFRISSGAIAEKDGIVVRVEVKGQSGFGESSPMSGSFYSSDTPDSCWRDLRETLIPALLGKEFTDAKAAAAALLPLPASNFAKAGLDTALWDLAAVQAHKPLYELLGGTNKPVESGLAVGLYDDVNDMLRAIERYLPAGYKRVKIKIERGRDIELVRAVRQAFGEIPLFVDANGNYELSDLAVFEQLDEYNLLMFEQPFNGRMIREHAELQQQVRTPVCLDESLETVEDLRTAIELGSFRIANIKLQRVGGFTNALRIYEICREHRIPVWLGTMPELGIGQAQSMALATLPHCSYPTDVEASARWFRDDIIKPWLEVKDGCLYPTATPGFGFSVDKQKVAEYALKSELFVA